eukprot:Lankesteria_metandrocarpae@DN10392_c0_g1_i1.p1
MFLRVNDAESGGLIAIAVTAVVMAFFWRSVLFAPLKLVAVFLHEFSHALATWLTGGRVSGIEIDENFGGVCYSVGGIRAVILSAGYIGSCMWGCSFVLMCAHPTTTRIAATEFIIACVATAAILKIKERRCFGCKCAFSAIMRTCILLMAAGVAIAWVMENRMPTLVFHPLTWSILALGTVCTLTAVYDTLHDVLLCKIDNEQQGKSDSVMFANEFGGTPRCWGLLWSIIALGCVSLSSFGYATLSAKVAAADNAA